MKLSIFTLMMAAIIVSGPAFAKKKCVYPNCPGDAPATVSALSSFAGTFVSTISSFGSVMTATMTRVTAQLQGELQKSATAKIQAIGAIENHATSLELKKSGASVLEAARIPQWTCSDLTLVSTGKEAEQKGRINTITGSNATTNYLIAGDQNIVSRIRQMSLDRYASNIDARRLNIKQGDRPGWDVDAQYLYGGPGGEPRLAEDQLHAINVMISRKSMLNAPQPLINPKDSAFAGYEEARKRHIALVSTANAAQLFIANGYKGK